MHRTLIVCQVLQLSLCTHNIWIFKLQTSFGSSTNRELWLGICILFFWLSGYSMVSIYNSNKIIFPCLLESEEESCNELKNYPSYLVFLSASPYIIFLLLVNNCSLIAIIFCIHVSYFKAIAYYHFYYYFRYSVFQVVKEDKLPFSASDQSCMLLFLFRARLSLDSSWLRLSFLFNFSSLSLFT